MLDGIDALAALQSTGTVSEAATRLRLTQSAVSKRIHALQSELGFVLVEPDGRKLRLTARALTFLDRARPLVAELRGLKRGAGTPAPARARFAIALADSIASSWGPEVIRAALEGLPHLEVSLHAHRSVLALESVRLGRYDIALCTESASARDLVQHHLVDEPIVLLHAGLAHKKSARDQPLITIEPTSATWRAIHPLLLAHHPRLLGGNVVFVESFGAVLQMVRAGFGNGLVPAGLAHEHRVPRRAQRELTGVIRQIALVTRKTVHQLPGFASLREQLELAARSVV